MTTTNAAPPPPSKIWRKTRVAGLYLHAPSGNYYSRFRLGKRRTFRSLKTKVWTVAKLKHARRGVDVEKDRQRGAELGTDFATLGALLREMERRLAATSVKPNTVVGRRNHMTRLRVHWMHGDFDTFLARNCTHDLIVELRQHLLNAAPWRYNFQRGKRVGFCRATVNQTLWVLRVLLDLAVEKMVIIENPFSVSTVLRGRLFAEKDKHDVASARKPLIPEVDDMQRIFAEMRRTTVSRSACAENQAYLDAMATELADHAELLAYSGMRLRESWRATVADDRGQTFKIWGTKSESSEREIEVNPALRVVLDRIRLRRIGPKAKLVITRDPSKAINRACGRLDLPRLNNHRLRHFFASVCIATTQDIPLVSRWLGHADGGVLAMKTYGHLLRAHAKAMAAKVDFRLRPDSAVRSSA